MQKLHIVLTSRHQKDEVNNSIGPLNVLLNPTKLSQTHERQEPPIQALVCLIGTSAPIELWLARTQGTQTGTDANEESMHSAV